MEADLTPKGIIAKGLMLLPKKSEYKICAQCQDKGVINEHGGLCPVCNIADNAICKNCGSKWGNHNGIKCLGGIVGNYEPDLNTVLKEKPKKYKCYSCHDETFWKNNWGVEVPCTCTYKCSSCSGKGYWFDYGERVPCKCAFGVAFKETEAAKKKANAEKEAKGLPVVELTDGKGILNDTVKSEYFGKGFIIDNTAEALEEKVKKKGVDLDIVLAKKNELMIDYDQEEIPEQFQKMLPILRQRFDKGTIFWKKQRSASGKHWHVIVTLPEEITDQERILWQAVFGSDYMREGLSLLRVASGMENPTLLFMPKNVTPVEVGVVEERPGRKFKEV